jgi:hypothetical protein
MAECYAPIGRVTSALASNATFYRIRFLRRGGNAPPLRPVIRTLGLATPTATTFENISRRVRVWLVVAPGWIRFRSAGGIFFRKPGYWRIASTSMIISTSSPTQPFSTA